MRLIEPTMEYDQQIRRFRREMLMCQDTMDGTGALKMYDDPGKWISFVTACKDPDKVRPGLVPASQFLYVREEDRKIIGMIQIRHRLNDFLEKYGGHIGYCVAPDERRNGYGTGMLRLALKECRKLGLEMVLITCIRGNEGSRRVIMNNGGIYESTVYESNRDLYLERYWIDIT